MIHFHSQLGASLLLQLLCKAWDVFSHIGAFSCTGIIHRGCRSALNSVLNAASPFENLLLDGSRTAIIHPCSLGLSLLALAAGPFTITMDNYVTPFEGCLPDISHDSSFRQLFLIL